MAGSLQGWSWELISGYKEPLGLQVPSQTIFLPAWHILHLQSIQKHIKTNTYK